MSSGLKWVENYFTISEATLMLMQSTNMVEYVASRPLEHSPGSYHYYSSGDANLVSGVIRNTIGNDRAYYELPYKSLMHRIGMLNTTIETDASGNFVSSSYSYGTTRDWARFGLLYANDGVFAGDTILPAGLGGIILCRKPRPPIQMGCMVRVSGLKIRILKRIWMDCLLMFFRPMVSWASVSSSFLQKSWLW